MPYHNCIIPNCLSHNKKLRVSFHSILLQSRASSPNWITFLNEFVPNFNFSSTSTRANLCSLHFVPPHDFSNFKYFAYKKDERLKLKCNQSVPTVGPLDVDIQLWNECVVEETKSDRVEVESLATDSNEPAVMDLLTVGPEGVLFTQEKKSGIDPSNMIHLIEKEDIKPNISDHLDHNKDVKPNVSALLEHNDDIKPDVSALLYHNEDIKPDVSALLDHNEGIKSDVSASVGLDNHGNIESRCKYENSEDSVWLNPYEDIKPTASDLTNQNPLCIESSDILMNTKGKLLKGNFSHYKFDKEGHIQINQHRTVHTVEKRFKCNICDKRFVRRWNLDKHLLWHSRKKPFKCEICDETFALKIDLSSHILSHTGTGDKLFKCDICEGIFTQKHILDTHILLHARGRPLYDCKFCGKTFSLKWNMEHHLLSNCDGTKLIHSQQKKLFKCEICGKRFALKIYLSAHILLHAGEKPFKLNGNKSIHYQQNSFQQNRSLQNIFRSIRPLPNYTKQIRPRPISSRPICPRPLPICPRPLPICPQSLPICPQTICLSPGQFVLI